MCKDDGVRKKVNDLLAAGSSYAMICRSLGEAESAPEMADRVTADSIRRHAARHFPVQHVARAVYREIVERRAQEVQVDFVNGVASALTPLAFYEVVMNEAFRQLVDGNVAISADTGLRAAEKLQALIDARAAGVDVAKMLADVSRIVEVMRTFVPSERWPEVQAALRRDDPMQYQRQHCATEGIRMVDIDDSPDEDDY
ncbi:hypothetical protein B5M45_30905 [Mycobacterium simiae]|uniref:Uncharacterized protein n=1 Tax=Mycobacterium simiae TaxID=1784 RepID=A0A1X0XI69_MYCSI|nr:hypothetical protein B5M45_30905 [Mycobacterium simiae]